MRYVSSLLAAATVVWALALTSREARAQTTTPSVTGILGAVQRCESGSTTCVSADSSGKHPHPNGVLVNVLNFEDCSSDLAYQFQLGIAYPNPSYTLVAWAGTQDCSPLAARQTPQTAVCWPVAPKNSNALSNPTLLSVRMQDIASGAFTTQHPVDYTVGVTDPNVCQGQTQTGASTVTLYIFFVDGGSNPVGTVQQYPVTLDMRAGNVGTVSAGIGDTFLVANVPSTTDPDTTGWNVYCDPAKGQEGSVSTVPVDAASNGGQCVVDSGSAGASDALADAVSDSASIDSAVDSATTPIVQDDAGGVACGIPLNDSGIPSPGGCSSSSVLVPGGGSASTTVGEGGTTTTTTASSEAGVTGTGVMNLLFQYGQPYAKYLCAQTGATSHAINVVGLKDGHYYNIAVAATDSHGNVGPLSNLACGQPLPVDDFWKVYYDAGGRAGGGFFCSAEGVGVPAGTTGLGVLMAASIVAMVRKRRRSWRPS